MLTSGTRTFSGASYWLIACRAIFLATLLSINALAGSPCQIIEDEFIKDITAGWKSFEVCEYRSPGENRGPFFTKALNLTPATAGKVIETKELVIRESSGGRGVHLGIAELEFPTVELAENVQGEHKDTKQHFFSGTKILTRYVSLRENQRILLVYSETHSDAKVNAFLEQVSNMGGRLWTNR
jgi:hypothetical protein